ncbi:protein of unknown function DUF81 [Thalassoporum mexicanum PCC 7367]|uniref:sulfite exporter TauE/SafE family protein n=1 Tax=Thalassoporum mexicanum TaxID=3457544 RepID=UPI00029FFE06|nr:sulfite exporter TauE/SafE family protein [Pseudanabaena sp. PCC 7367]AFY69354.1 protein of unknown function DUF81 [Pseudanabaena sp. PCC 7367]
MNLTDAILLLIAAIMAGALNAIAGGGSFFSFPALIFVGITPISANATSTVALWPGIIASAIAYRGKFSWQWRQLVLIGLVSMVGGVAGALLLLRTSDQLFRQILPYLMLAATLLFTFGKSLTNRVATYLAGRSKHIDRRDITNHPVALAEQSNAGYGASWWALPLFLAIAVYGGFFGGGLGILLLASLTILGMENINQMNAIKTLLNACINGMAIAQFAISNVVFWPQAALMAIGAIVGGYLSAHYAQRLKAIWVRRFVIVVAFGLTGYFFVRG